MRRPNNRGWPGADGVVRLHHLKRIPMAEVTMTGGEVLEAFAASQKLSTVTAPGRVKIAIAQLAAAVRREAKTLGEVLEGVDEFHIKRDEKGEKVPAPGGAEGFLIADPEAYGKARKEVLDAPVTFTAPQLAAKDLAELTVPCSLEPLLPFITTETA